MGAPTIGAQASKGSMRSPNIIVILADDQGWGTTSVLMDPAIAASKSDYIKTPNLEALAKRAVVFTNGYAAHPNCSPTRASILTGLSPAALHLTDIIERHKGPLYENNKLIPAAHIDGLPDDILTIAAFIKSKRPEYQTAHFGKWHLGNGGPEKHGFDKSDGETSNREGNLRLDGNPKDIYGITERGIAWMKNKVAEHKPFYMQLSHYATHLAIEAKRETIEKVKGRPVGQRHNDTRFAAMSEDLDDGIGRLMRAIKEAGIEDNTYIVYLADNGSQPTKSPGNINGPLHGWKATVWEGGVRVPFLVAGPGIKHAYAKQTVVSYDLFPTICEWLDIRNLPKQLEGGSLVAALRRPASELPIERPRDFVVFHFPHYQLEKGSQPATAMIKERFKLIHFYEDDKDFLFDLRKDIAESKNLADQQPDRVKQMRKEMQRYLSSINAVLPAPNPAYTASKDPGRKFADIKKRLLTIPYFVIEK